VLFDLNGHEVGIAQREWTHNALPDVPGSQVFDTARNWELLATCIQESVEASAAADRVLAVSATSMREGMVLCDKGGHELWACPNVDARATDQAKELVQSGMAEEIFRIAGDWVSITAPARFLWLQRHEPRVVDEAQHLLMLSDWVGFKLCGEYATDPSAGSSSGMFDLAARTWSHRIMDMCGLDKGILPPILEPGTVLGEVTREASAKTGLPVGTKVVLGGADTQLGLVGIGAHSPGATAVIGGSFWQCAQVCDAPLIDPAVELRTLCHSVPGRWMVEGIGFFSGLALRWFRDAFCEGDIEHAHSLGIDPYELLERSAKDVPPGSRGVLAMISNVMSAKSWDHAAPSLMQFDMLAPASSGKAESVRAIQEAAAYVAHEHALMLYALTGVAPREILFAGGAAKGSLWPQILADVFGVSVVIPAVTESTALGAAMYAGIGAGIWDDIDDALAIAAPTERSIQPDASRHREYEHLAPQWKTVYEHMLELTHQTGLRPMWRAPNA
jgi:autoinducer 2 (AI-2) kinase